MTKKANKKRKETSIKGVDTVSAIFENKKLKPKITELMDTAI
jgi:hypothetical protein